MNEEVVGFEVVGDGVGPNEGHGVGSLVVGSLVATEQINSSRNDTYVKSSQIK